MGKEIEEISDRLNEASLKISGLKKKNNRREKDINHMAEKADKLMKKYNELKEKSIKDKHDQFDKSKQLNTVIGSRMMDYVLNKTYFKQMRISLNFIQDFSKFDKNFSHSIRLVVKIFDRQSKLNLEKCFHQWHKNALSPTKIAQLPNQILKGTESDKERLNLKLMNEEKSQKENRSVNLEKSAKERLKRVFNAVIIREQKRMFD